MTDRPTERETVGGVGVGGGGGAAAGVVGAGRGGHHCLLSGHHSHRHTGHCVRFHCAPGCKGGVVTTD